MKKYAVSKPSGCSDTCGCSAHATCSHAHAEEESTACACDEDAGCGCGCGRDHGAGDESHWKSLLLRLILAGVFLIGALLVPVSEEGFAVSSPLFWVKLGLFVVSYLIAGGDVLWRAVRNIFRGRVFDENFLMSIATVGAFVIGEYAEGVAVMLFYQLGEMFQDIAVSRSRRSITALMDIRPDFARRRIGGELVVGPPEEVSVDDIIVVNPGERIPLDGVVVKGVSFLDTSALTGESVPQEAGEGQDVLSGSINQNATLEIRVSKAFHDSTVSKILELTQNAASRKANTEQFITRFARIYTPIVVLAAVLTAVLPPLFLGRNTFGDWFYRALIFLVVSCPCALVVSIPLGFFSGIGSASRHGILVKGSNYLEALTRVDTVMLDKTGTLTRGKFQVQTLYPSVGVTEETLLETAALAESRSTHPIAKSVLERYAGTVDDARIAEYKETAGFGTEVTLTSGAVIRAGNEKLMRQNGIAIEDASAAAGSVVHVAKDGQYFGRLLIADNLKPTSKEAVARLKKAGVKNVVMLTGDSVKAAAAVAKEAGITSWKAELLPQDKVAAVDEQLKKENGGKLAFVGDGINDAPVIARADIGVAMGGIGSDAAIEAADIVLMTDDLLKLPLAIRIARKTRRIVTQNIVFALGIKAIVLILSLFGITNMWMAIFADVGVALLAILNALRTMLIKEE